MVRPGESVFRLPFEVPGEAGEYTVNAWVDGGRLLPVTRQVNVVAAPRWTAPPTARWLPPS